MSWGIKITILYVGFVCLILTLVVMSFSHKVDLVSPDYYGQELKFQERIDAGNNSESLNEQLIVAQNKKIFSVQLPSFFAGKKLNGEILFFRASDSSKDKKIKLNPDTTCRQEIEVSTFLPGAYKIKIDADCEGKNYYFEKDLFLK